MDIRKASWFAFALVVAAVGSASPARADDLVTAKVPFPFVVGDERLPAGDYVVRNLPDGSGVLQVASADGHRAVFVTTTPAATAEDEAIIQPKLTFAKFNRHYFLAGINPSDGNAREVVLTPKVMEQELQKATLNAEN